MVRVQAVPSHAAAYLLVASEQFEWKSWEAHCASPRLNRLNVDAYVHYDLHQC